MLDKVVCIETPEEYEWVFPGPNQPPPNLKRITEKELAQNTRFGSYTPEFLGFNQVFLKKATKKHPHPPIHSLHYYIFHDMTGVAIEVDYWGDGYYDKPKPKEPLEHVRYYSFAKCEHEYDKKTVGRCLHQYTCRKCGYSHTVDSSD